MNKISQEDLSLFKTVTCEDDNTASIYLHRYPDVNTAIANYFSAKEAEANQAPSNGTNSSSVPTNINGSSQNNMNPGTQNRISMIRRSKTLQGKKSALKKITPIKEKTTVQNMEIENEGDDEESNVSENLENPLDENSEYEEGEIVEEIEEGEIVEEEGSGSEMCDQDEGKEEEEPIVDDDTAQFVAVTNCDNKTARAYLNRYKRLDSAIDMFFRQEGSDESPDVQSPPKPTSKPGPNPGVMPGFNPTFPTNSNFMFPGMNMNPSLPQNFFLSPQPLISGAQRIAKMNSQALQSMTKGPASFQNFPYDTPIKKCKLRGSYENYVKKYAKKSQTDQTQWPKFIGSLVVTCWVPNDNLRQKIQLNDEIKFEANEIDFSSTNIVRKIKKNNTMVSETVGKNWYIKGKSLNVNCKWKGQAVGELNCDYAEIFVFLLARKYVFLEGTVIELAGLGFNNYNTIQVQMDVFLTEEIIKNPINVISIPGRKRGGKDRSGQDEATQKTHQMLKLSKEAFVKLFAMLQVQVSIPSIVKLRQRIDPFQRVRREKYEIKFGRRKSKSQIRGGPPALLITEDFPDYYKENKESLPIQNSLRSSNTKIFTGNSNSLGNLKNEESSEFSADESDEEELNRNFVANTQNGFSRFSRLNSKPQIDSKVSLKDEADEEKLNEDLFNSENQIASYYAESRVPETLKSELHVYQKQALSWMRYREECIDKSELFDKTFEEQRLLNDLFQEMTLLDGTKLYFNPFNGEMSLDFPTIKACKGGILADEMGLGKTVMTIALLHSHKRSSFTKEDIRRIEKDSEDEEEEDEEEFVAKTVRKGRRKGKKNEDSDFEIEDAPTIKKNTKKNMKRTLTSFFTATKKQTKKDLNKLFNGLDELDAIEESEDEESDEEIVGKKPTKKVKSSKGKGRPKKAEKEEKDDEEELGVNLPKDKKSKKATKTVKKAKKARKLGGTLIIVPLTVLSQWKKEIERHSEEDSLKVLQFYGNSRKSEVIQGYDVVLTTYGVLETEFAKHKKNLNSSELFDCDWFRVILDEAHYIKTRQTKTAKAACELVSEYRWCLTGTPLQNRLDDMFSLLQFLKMDTWGEYFWWNTYINKYISHDEASNLIRGILKPVILRRTKKSTYLDGRNILELPPKEIKNVFVKLSEEERSVYNSFFQKSRAQFNEMVDGGTLGYEYTHVFELLIRLRQVCDHAALVFSVEDLKDKGSLDNAVYKFLQGKAQEKSGNKAKGKTMEIEKDIEEEKTPNENEDSKMCSEFIKKTMERLKNKELEPCCICFEEITIPAIAKCGHIFCKQCLELILLNTKKCALCQSEISPKDVMTVTLEDKEKCKDLLNMNCTTFKKSAKLNAVLEAAKEVAKRKEKVVIFSQFIGMLNLIERFLKEEGLGYKRIDGSSSMQTRVKRIEEFNTDENVTVFLISLQAGAIGLNLTVASNVFLVDPWWNPAVEDQAIERVHRIGQKNNVNVLKFVCERTIEERIIQLNAQKKVMINSILQFNPQEQKKQNLKNMMYVMEGFEDES